MVPDGYTRSVVRSPQTPPMPSAMTSRYTSGATSLARYTNVVSRDQAGAELRRLHAEQRGQQGGRVGGGVLAVLPLRDLLRVGLDVVPLDRGRQDDAAGVEDPAAVAGDGHGRRGASRAPRRRPAKRPDPARRPAGRRTRRARAARRRAATRGGAAAGRRPRDAGPARHGTTGGRTVPRRPAAPRRVAVRAGGVAAPGRRRGGRRCRRRTCRRVRGRRGAAGGRGPPRRTGAPPAVRRAHPRPAGVGLPRTAPSDRRR